MSVTRIVNPEMEFFAHLAQGRFMLQRCRDTGRFVFYPRVAAPRSGSRNLEWVPAAGTGTVYSTTVVRNRRPEPDHNVALIDLAERVRIMSCVVGIAAEDVRIGMTVRARIIPPGSAEGQQPLLVFEPC